MFLLIPRKGSDHFIDSKMCKCVETAWTFKVRQAPCDFYAVAHLHIMYFKQVLKEIPS